VLCSLVGIGIAGLSALKFKAHSENPQQNKITVPIVLAMVAALLIALPTYINTSTNTLFDDTEAGGIDGRGLDGIGG
jgi:intracellular multiplication protein IcmD